MRSPSYDEFVRCKAISERYMSEYWLQQEQDHLCLNSRSQITSNLNISKNVVRMISGYQRATRKNIILQCDSDDLELQKATDYYGFALSALCSKARVYERISNSFAEAISFGVSAIAINFFDEGVSCCDIASPSMIFDENFFDNGDFNDCNFVGLRRKISRAETFAKYSELFTEIEQSAPIAFNESSFYFKNYFIQDFFYKWKVGKYIQILTQGNQFLVQKNSPRHRKVIQRLLLDGLPFVEKEMSKKVPCLTVFVNGVQVSSDCYPFLPDVFPCVALTGNIFSPFENYTGGRWGDAISGVVRELRDLQSLMGRVLSSLDAVLDSRRIGGWLYKQGAVDEQAVNSLDKYGNIAIASESIADSIQRIEIPQLPESYTGFINQIFDLLKATGINEEMLGIQQEGADSGALLSMLRQSAGLVVLNKYFDSMDHATKRIGEIVLAFMLQMQPDYLKSVVGLPIPTKPITTAPLRIVVEEGINSDLQKRRRFAGLLELYNLGILEDKSVLIDAAPIQNKSRIMEVTLKQSKIQQEQAIKAQQKEAELQAIGTEMELKKVEAETLKDRTQAEKNLAEARKSDSQSLKNAAEVKAATQI